MVRAGGVAQTIRRALNDRDAVEIAAKVLDALAHAHRLDRPSRRARDILVE
jgi:hypothetical protein